MAGQTNIQILFNVITVDGIQRYLVDHGWKPRESPGADRLYFERERRGGEEAATIWTWATTEHPKFRSQVPNIIFTLSILESRPALEIANDMHDARPEPPAAKVEAAAPPKPAVAAAAEAAPPVITKKQRCVLRLARATALIIPLDVLDEHVELAAGDVVEIVYYGAAGAELDLEIGERTIQVRIPRTSGVRLLQGVAKPCLGERWSATHIVREELGPLEDAGENKAAAELLEALDSTLARIDFELEAGEDRGATVQSSLRRQAAMLAGGIARRLEDTPLARQIVWRTCAKLIYPVGLRLELLSNSVDELFAAAATDDEFSPRKTLAWLKEHAVAIDE